MTQELVTLQVNQSIATITLDSPDNRNALSAQLRAELLGHLQSALSDDEVRLVVLTHSGSVFCSGMDLKEARAGLIAGDELPRTLALLWESPKPVIARLSGPARAGGLGIVGACDIAVVTDDVTFAFTEVRIGVVPALISVTLLPRMPSRAANELMLTGETFDARRAVELGLVNSAVPAAQLDDEVRRYAALLLRGAPGALAGTKAMLRSVRPATIEADLAKMGELSATYFGSAEAKEGMAAFAEKRPPNWVN